MQTETHLFAVLAGAPPSASRRGYLRRGLPSVYHDPPGGTPEEAFAMRFLLGLEEVLDPIVATIDLLPAHLDLKLAPPELVALVAGWLGVELDGGLPSEAHRRLVRQATQITRARGTSWGLERMLALAFGRSDIEVRDGGGATWSEEPGPRPAGDATLTVVCPPSVPLATQAAIRRLVDEVRPAHVSVELSTAEGESR